MILPARAPAAHRAAAPSTRTRDEFQRLPWSISETDEQREDRAARGWAAGGRDGPPGVDLEFSGLLLDGSAALAEMLTERAARIGAAVSQVRGELELLTQ
jgi:hypothetical protein